MANNKEKKETANEVEDVVVDEVISQEKEAKEEPQENMVPRWYVVHTYSGYENKVKKDLEKTVKNRELEDFFFDIVVPMEEQIEIKDGKRKSNYFILG